MADQIRVKLGIPKCEDDDVERRELSVTVDGGTPTVSTVEVDFEEKVVAELGPFPQGSQLHFSLIDIDDANPPNRSEASALDFEAADTVPPAKPGELSIEGVVEE